MNYKVLFRIERLKLVDKLKAKIVNYRKYCEEMGDTCEIEIVCAGNVVTHFLEEDDFFKDESLQVRLCKNALNGLKPVSYTHLTLRTYERAYLSFIGRT